MLYLWMVYTGTGCSIGGSEYYEADILSCTVPGNVLKTEPRIENDRITLMVRQETDLTQLAPQFTLSEGATIHPASGSSRDFSEPQTYVVTSHDQKWEKTYTVTCATSGMSQHFHFEHSEINAGYYVFYELSEDGSKQYIWATGNPGYVFLTSSKDPDDYPTSHYANGRTGKAIKLETRKTNWVGSMAKVYIVPGNLYNGDFVVAQAMLDPLKATHFGTPCDFIPTELTGYYKYAAGEPFLDEKGKAVEGKKDKPHIYAIVFETDDQVKYLDGYGAVESDHLIATAEMEDSQKQETDEWTYFNLPFRFKPGKSIDPEKLREGVYHISLIFSSSAEGNDLRGAIGSTLLLDDITLIREEEE